MLPATHFSSKEFAQDLGHGRPVARNSASKVVPAKELVVSPRTNL